MTSISEPRDFRQPVVNHDDPVITPPPLLAIGPLAWMRKNLFSSVMDTIITVVSSLIIVTVVTTFVRWTVQQANWFIIVFNLRQFMVGLYEPEYEWRVQFLVLLIAFTVGFTIAAWSRIPRPAAILGWVLIALLFIIPPIIAQVLPLPSSYLAAGNAEILSGTATEIPQNQLAFIARAGETVRVQFAHHVTDSDESLARLSSFADVSANALRNAAADRLETEQRIAEINAQLESDLLTENQRTLLTTELERLEVTPPVTQTYTLNQTPVTVRVLDGATLEPLAETVLEPEGEPLELTLPADGWYVIEKTTPEDSAGVALLQVDGIYPLLERSFVRFGDTDEEAGSGGRGAQYVRMIDAFTIEETRPAIDGKDVPMILITDNQYRGERPLGEYLRLFLGPFLAQISKAFFLIALLATIGYIVARQVDRFLSPKEYPRKASRRSATWLLVAIPPLLFVFTYGLPGVLPLTDTRRWGGLMLTFLLTIVGIIASFPIGILLALGRRSTLPAIKYFCILYIEFVRGVPLLTVLFMAQLLLPLVNPSLSEFPNVFRAMVGITLFSAAYLAENVRGGLQAIPPGQVEAAKAIGLRNDQIIRFITLPQALRLVLPTLVGQCISLFKDTSLVAIVGLLDLTGVARNVIAQTEFLGQRREVFVFIVLIYFTFSYTIASVSRRIEASGSGAANVRTL